MSSLSQSGDKVIPNDEEVDEAAVNRIMGRTKDEFSELNLATRVRIFQEIVQAHEGLYAYSSEFKTLDDVVSGLVNPTYSYALDTLGTSGHVSSPPIIMPGAHKDIKSKYYVLYRSVEPSDMRAVVYERGRPTQHYNRRYDVEVLLLSRNARLLVVSIGFVHDDTHWAVGRQYIAECFTIQPVGFEYVGKWLKTGMDLRLITYWIPILLENASSATRKRSESLGSASEETKDCLARTT